MSDVKLRRVPFNDEHLDQKWLVIEGYIDGCPAVTKRVTMDTAALASIPDFYENKVAKLRADVAEYYVRYNAVREKVKDL